ncbi:FAD-dependent oxidoreductase, partial [Staphylococcus epidermidis]|uniref:FAD-dependent oxidoreductase n=1 Tax=Staphylococcus epidermidis TaxID=1282 RepID=UPI001642C14E
TPLPPQPHKLLYQQQINPLLHNHHNLHIMQAMLHQLIIQHNQLKPLPTNIPTQYPSKPLIITTPTFLPPQIILPNLKYSTP